MRRNGSYTPPYLLGLHRASGAPRLCPPRRDHELHDRLFLPRTLPRTPDDGRPYRTTGMDDDDEEQTLETLENEFNDRCEDAGRTFKAILSEINCRVAAMHDQTAAEEENQRIHVDLFKYALHENYNLSALKALLKNGAPLRCVDEGGEPFCVVKEAIAGDKLGLLKHIASQTVAMDSDEMRAQALHDAAEYGRAKIFGELIKMGCDVNKAGTRDGATILHSAASGESANIVKKLIELGVGITLRDNDGKTALDLAEQSIRAGSRSWRDYQEHHGGYGVPGEEGFVDTSNLKAVVKVLKAAAAQKGKKRKAETTPRGDD